ncbi:MAG TPA: MFS transporter [Chloroflexota bacterium]|nr:MFS transporter [Chloroflexota bacterium]
MPEFNAQAAVLTPSVAAIPAVPAQDLPAEIDVEAGGSGQRKLVLGVVNASHFLNHVQSAMVSVLYPIIMEQMGFGTFEVGVLQTIYQLASQGGQVVYGFLGRFFRHSLLLSVSNLLVGIFSIATGWCQNYGQMFGTRLLSGAGTSAEHPIGSAMLVSYFGKARARALSVHNSAGNLGALVAPAIVGGLLLFTDWRGVFYIVAIPSLIMGASYILLRDNVTVMGGSKKERAKASMQEYRALLKNRTVMLVSLVQMAGAAGRGTGVNVAFLSLFFISALHVDVKIAAVLLTVYQVGGLFGPIGIGWLADRMSRKLIIQLTLVGSTASTLWLLAHHGITPWLIINLLLYGSVVNSRGSLTLAMVSDEVPLEQTSTAFSLYYFIGFISGPIWTLLTGWIIGAHGFGQAFTIISFSYLAGVVLVAFTRNTPAPLAPIRGAG